jgi:hypothetical protein
VKGNCIVLFKLQKFDSILESSGNLTTTTEEEEEASTATEDAIIDSLKDVIKEVDFHGDEEGVRMKDDDLSNDDDRNIVLKMSIFVVLMIVLCLIATYLIYKKLQHPYEHPVLLARRKSEMPS